MNKVLFGSEKFTTFCCTFNTKVCLENYENPRGAT